METLSCIIFCLLASSFKKLYAADLRLVSSTKTSTFVKGILNIYHNGEWGTVCDDSWDIRDTNVACRKLGYVKGLAHMHLGEGSGEIWLDDLACTGSESSLDSCSHAGWGVENCDHNEDIGIVCQTVPDISVRLVGGSNAKEGRIEIQFNSVWGTVCDDYWDINDATVICKMLGHQKALRLHDFGSGSGQIWLDDVLCKGDEDSIAKCRHNGWGIHNCGHGEDTGVVCQPKGSPDVSTRLVAGSVSNTGRVEIRYYGTWRTVCDTNWDLQDAHVICRMKGYSQGAIAFIKGLQSSGNAWLFDMSCNGHESSIERCSRLNWRHGSCSDNSRAGVVCSSGSPNTAFRLTSGINNYVGRLEVRYYGTWGAVCSNTIDLNGAHVVCRMLGYRQAVTIYKKGHSGSIPRFSLLLQCTGDETSTEECGNMRSSQVKSCESDVWILCRPTSGLSWTTKLRLVGGSTPEEGRVETQHYGVWGTVCNSGWGIHDANVVCRMLNYKGAITARQRFGSGTGPIWLTGLRCKGDEKDVLNCTHRGLGQTSSCNHGNDAGVVCHSYNVQDPNVAVRLVNGSTPNQGRVEVRYYGVWGTVCDDSWGLADAHVVCRMLDYKKASWAGTARVKGSGLILLDDVSCRGNEKSLEHCRNRGWGQHDCSHSEDAGVRCESATKAEMSATVRLTDTKKKHVGQVEVNYNGIWRPVCDDTWDILDAHVVCRMLGYKAAVAPIRQYRRGVNGLWMGGVECSGEEVSISECYHRGWSNTQCSGNYYAGVMCQVNEVADPLKVQVRLEEGSSPNSGRVAVRYGNVWGTICNRGLDINDAKVICRMLGYVGGVRQYTSKPGNGTIWLSNLRCNGTEKSIVDCRHPGWGQTTPCNHGNDVAIKCQDVDAPQFQISGTNAITDLTVVILFNSSKPVEVQFKSVYQVAVEKRDNEQRFKSNKQPLPFVFNEVNVTMATEMSNNSYITAEILGPISNLTIGDGQYYHGYYNAPLEPGSMYRVHVRIVTMAMDGKTRHGHSGFVAFTTKTEPSKAQVEKLTLSASVFSVIVIGLSVFIVILIGVVVAGIACYFLKLRNPPPASGMPPLHLQGLEMNTYADDDNNVSHTLPYDDTELYVNTRDFHASCPQTKKSRPVERQRDAGMYAQVRS